jgi:hypothetical protein
VARVNLPPGEKEVKLRLLDPAGQTIREVTAPVNAADSHLRVVSARYIQGQVLLPVPANANVALDTDKER